jgi:hypothetical protein
MVYIDYGLGAFRRSTVDRYVPAGAVADLADVYHRLSVAGELEGYEVTERFYEVGSISGLEDFRSYVASRGSSVD